MNCAVLALIVLDSNEGAETLPVEFSEFVTIPLPFITVVFPVSVRELAAISVKFTLLEDSFVSSNAFFNRLEVNVVLPMTIIVSPDNVISSRGVNFRHSISPPSFTVDISSVPKDGFRKSTSELL